MTARVRVLPDGVIDQIAAGEVVERPASVVKELVDNALDAGAQRVEVTLEGAGKERVVVADDGHGMDREDALLALQRHATSKIADAADLGRIATLGFRGEALPSIAAVSRLVLETAGEGGEGTRVRIDGGEVAGIERIARARGTTVDVRRLFHNTPARRKFLKTHATEQSTILQRLVEFALARIDVAWRTTHGRREILALPPAPTLAERLVGLYDAAYVETLLRLAYDEDAVAVNGVVQRAAAATASRRRQFVFVNGRPVDAMDILRAALRGYRSTLPAGARPDLFLFLRLPTDEVDVNVHPTKRDVRFRDPAAVAATVEEAVRAALGAGPAAARPLRPPGMRVADRPATGRGGPERADQLAMFLRRGEQRGAEAGGSNGAPAAVPEEGAGSNEPMELALWQLHRRFILAQTASGLVVIDQHSAHERILYEEVSADLREGSRPGQRLLFPLVLHLTPGQRATWEQYRGLIDRLGFEIEPFGGDSVAVSAVPAFRHAFDAEAALAGLLDDLERPGRGSADMNQHERVARLFACKAAIKAGATLTAEEMNELIGRLFATRLPYDDVHGRPAILQISLDDLNRHFGRH